MTFLEIEAFLKITETGSFSAAAEALYVTQPALGRRIRAMEEELGYPLFVRGKGLRKVELTRQGHAFIGIAHRWQALWYETREAALLAPSRNFSVASVGSLLAFMLPTVFRTFMKENPECSLHVSTLHSSEAYSYVGNRSVDIAFITDPIYSSSVGTHILFKEKLCLVAGKELNLPEHVRIRELDPQLEIRSWRSAPCGTGILKPGTAIFLEIKPFPGCIWTRWDFFSTLPRAEITGRFFPSLSPERS